MLNNISPYQALTTAVITLTALLMQCGIFARKAMVNQAREGLCYQRKNT